MPQPILPQRGWTILGHFDMAKAYSLGDVEARCVRCHHVLRYCYEMSHPGWFRMEIAGRVCSRRMRVPA
jgi:hypothetical protein